MYLSIDFEDFNHDFKRSLGIWKTGPIMSDILWEKYLLIDKVFRNSNNGKGSYGTFFCTGILAKKEPDLIKRIANDGHEIGCHYYFHDDMKSDSLNTIDKNLKKAVNFLEEASSKKVIGFRAPYFSIEKRNPSHYKVIEKLFLYDSSFCCTTKDQLKIFKKKMELKRLQILPVFQNTFCKVNLKLGGSFLKIFPRFYIDWMKKNAIKNGFVPHIYLHPYEFGISEKLKINKNDLKKLGFYRSKYWHLRQNQWLNLGNESLLEKVDYLLNYNKFDGVLSNLLK